MGLLVIFVSLLIPLVLSFVFLPRTLRFAGELVGYYFRRSSRTRQELLLARVATETRNCEAEQRKTHKNEDDDWEEVEGATVGTAVNGGRAENEWEGIVAFFHPFW